jgi:hypothetical protein
MLILDPSRNRTSGVPFSARVTAGPFLVDREKNLFAAVTG